MVPQTESVLALVLGYLLGSVPFAFLLSRQRGIDLRAVGSGNVGAANVLRTSGVAAAIAAMCLDAAKGCVAVLLAQRFGGNPAASVVAGLGSIVGHMYPAWLGFRGGKGVATAAGVFGILAPAALLFGAGVFVVAVSLSRYISVGSVAGTITLAAATLAFDMPAHVIVGAMLAAILIVFRHRGNLSRLIAGSERRVGLRL